jgi:hypothetical protein
MYQQYPTQGQGPLPQRPEPPQQLQNAVRLMYAGAGLSAVSFIVGLVTIGSLKSTIRADDPSFTNAQVNAGVTIALVIAGIFGLIGLGPWIWMALANRAGKSWARVVATVFFGIDTVGLLASFARTNTGASIILEVLVWLVGLGAIILMWNRESSAYYQFASGTPR